MEVGYRTWCLDMRDEDTFNSCEEFMQTSLALSIDGSYPRLSVLVLVSRSASLTENLLRKLYPNTVNVEFPNILRGIVAYHLAGSRPKRPMVAKSVRDPQHFEMAILAIDRSRDF